MTLKKQVAYLGIQTRFNSNPNTVYHVTLDYLGNKTDDYINSVLSSAPLGKPVIFNTNYAGRYKDTNFGYSVELPDALVPFFKHEIPHITTLCVNGGKPVDTWKAFTDIPESEKTTVMLLLVGIVGWFDHKGNFHTEW